MAVNCQIFTPSNYVEELLDNVKYNENLYGKLILENACGDGNILISIVKRYIDDCRLHHKTKTEIKNGLERDIYAVEIDEYYHEICMKNLDELLTKEKLGKVKWKIYKGDYLTLDFEGKFDFIVSNPPYITYRDLDEDTRVFLKQKFISCHEGKFDYCYAFIEKSFNDLNVKGKMSYLIPSSIFKTVFGFNLRELIKPKVIRILDYTSEKIFNNALVASAILVLNKSFEGNTFEYIDIVKNDSFFLSIEELGKKWSFSRMGNSGTRMFGDFFNVAHVVATLYNKAFVINKWSEESQFIVVNGFQIEKNVIHNSSSPKAFAYQRNSKIIFPYYYVNNELKKYTDEEFREKFPKAEAYLNQFRERLDKRDRDVNAKWFEYGRSQALNKLKQKKILTSTIISNHIKIYPLDEDNIPYSGIFITTISDYLSLDDARSILESKDFYAYACKIGIHVNGESIRITSKDIMNFKF